MPVRHSFVENRAMRVFRYRYESEGTIRNAVLFICRAGKHGECAVMRYRKDSDNDCDFAYVADKDAQPPVLLWECTLLTVPYVDRSAPINQQANHLAVPIERSTVERRRAGW